MGQYLSDYEGKNILVTGGAGCIGSNLCRRLSELNAGKVTILDDLSAAYEWNIPRADNIEFVGAWDITIIMGGEHG